MKPRARSSSLCLYSKMLKTSKKDMRVKRQQWPRDSIVEGVTFMSHKSLKEHNFVMTYLNWTSKEFIGIYTKRTCE